MHGHNRAPDPLRFPSAPTGPPARNRPAAVAGTEAAPAPWLALTGFTLCMLWSAIGGCWRQNYGWRKEGHIAHDEALARRKVQRAVWGVGGGTATGQDERELQKPTASAASDVTPPRPALPRPVTRLLLLLLLPPLLRLLVLILLRLRLLLARRRRLLAARRLEAPPRVLLVEGLPGTVHL
jgi:hypothetical protein